MSTDNIVPIDKFKQLFDEHRPKTSRVSADGRPEIYLSAEEFENNDEGITALAGDPDIYQRGGKLVHVTQETKKLKDLDQPPGVPLISEIRPANIRERLTKNAVLLRKDQDGAWRPSGPPNPMASAIYSRAVYQGIRHLRGVVEIPVLLPDGRLLTRPGYDDGSGLLYMPSGLIPVVPDNPSQSDAIRALGLFRDLVCDFPFATDADFSTWLVGLLTLFARYAFAGPAPLIACDASVRGSGKSLLVDLISLIFTGRPAPRMSPTGDDEEWRKRILTLARSGVSLILIDNVIAPLGSAALDMALTGEVAHDRLLGTMDDCRVELLAVWFATGNNLQFKGDLARRVFVSRLIPQCESPEERSDFKHPDLRAHVLRERKSLVEAALTILVAYCAAGRPRQVSPLGSFEGWSDHVRSAAVWAGAADPIETNRKARKADPIKRLLPILFQGIRDLDSEKKGISAGDILNQVNTSVAYANGSLKTAILELCGREGSLPDSQAFGRFLTKHREVIAGGLQLKERALHGVTLRYVEDVWEAPSASVSSPSVAVSPAPSAESPRSGEHAPPAQPAPLTRGALDGPGWVDTACSACGKIVGKRPRGSKISAHDGCTGYVSKAEAASAPSAEKTNSFQEIRHGTKRQQKGG
jgi:hypothetical protein